MNFHSDNSPRCRSCCVTTTNLSREGWQERYDTGKTGWDRGEPNPMLARWLTSGELQPGKVLVPGCGRGHEVVALAAAGFEVTAIDFADAAVKTLNDELHRRNLKATVIQSDIFAYSPTHSFDAVYEQTSLCAIHPSQWQTYQQLLACWLRSEGKLFALFMQNEQPDGPPYGCHMKTMRELFSSPTWLWSKDATRVDHPTGLHEYGCVITRQETSA